MNMQERTALADTPGSQFTSKCEALIAEVNFGELLSEFTAHIDLLFKKVTDKGANRVVHIWLCTCCPIASFQCEVSMLVLQRAWIAVWMC